MKENTIYMCNLISLAVEAAKDAMNGDEKNVAAAIKHIENVDLYGDLSLDVKRHFACVLANILMK